MEKLSKRPNLPDLAKFKRQFEEKYRRKMTLDEARTFQLIEKLLLDPPEEAEENDSHNGHR